jgi:hypothetical protein
LTSFGSAASFGFEVAGSLLGGGALLGSQAGVAS